MKKLKRLVTAFLASAMAFSLVACGGTASSTGGEQQSTAASAGSTAAATGDVVTLKWVTVGNGMPGNYDSWAAKINEYLGEKIGVNIQMEVVPWGDWDSRRNVIVSTGGEYDIMFTNMGTYNNDVKIGAFADLTELLPKVPELYNLMPEEYWDACRINGQIYAVPTYKDSSQSEFIVWDSELISKLNLDVASIDTLEKMEPALKALKEETGEAPFTQYKTGASYLFYEYDNMNSGLPPLGVRFDDKEAKVVYTFEQKDIFSNLELFHKWYNEGLINADAATKPEEQTYRPVMIAQGWAGAAKTAWGPNLGMEAVAYQWGPTIVSNDTVRGSLNCISANSKNPEKALEFLQLLNTDAYVRDSFFYGEQGADWEYTSDNKVHRNRTDWEMAGYTQGTFFLVTPTDEVDFNQWDEVLELNKKAEPSVLLGFTFDTTKVDDQLVNCSSIWERYKGELTTGTVDPKVAVPAMLEELNAAGFQDIITEAQAQVDAFMATK